jgi:hypothetical protein
MGTASASGKLKFGVTSVAITTLPIHRYLAAFTNINLH